MLSAFNLNGRGAIVTGASKGLGYVAATALAQAGADLVITSRHADELERVAANLREETGRRVFPIAADITETQRTPAVVEEAVSLLGQIDILINNAGINIRKPALEKSEDVFRKMLDVNLVGLFEMTKAVARRMVEQKRGAIVNVASMVGLVGIAERAGYTASKGGLIQLTRTLALEWAPHNVRVNALCPGPFMTDMNKPILEKPEANRFFLDRIPLGRWGRPEELGAAFVFLAADASSFMTGATLVIDGGWTAQ